MNAVFDGYKWHNVVDEDKNKFAAIYADSSESNYGLPFWLGKITKIDRHRNPEQDDPGLKDNEEESDTYEAVEIADYYQKTNLMSAGDRIGTGKYEKHLVDGAPVRGGGRTAGGRQSISGESAGYQRRSTEGRRGAEGRAHCYGILNLEFVNISAWNPLAVLPMPFHNRGGFLSQRL